MDSLRRLQGKPSAREGYVVIPLIGIKEAYADLFFLLLDLLRLTGCTKRQFRMDSMKKLPHRSSWAPLRLQ